jgi:enamine deaminase RidA (YjgF/YER057c/UK114 family)
VDGAVTTPHRIVNPDTLAAPVGYAHAVVASPGRSVHVAGQTGLGPDGRYEGATMAEQLEQAAANVVAALHAAGAGPEHVVALQIFVTDVDEYKGSLEEIGAAYRRHFGRHYPAMALLEVSALFDPEAKVELVAQAVVPD